MDQRLLELLIEQLNEAVELLDDVDDGAEARGVLKAAIRTAGKLKVSA